MPKLIQQEIKAIHGEEEGNYAENRTGASSDLKRIDGRREEGRKQDILSLQKEHCPFSPLLFPSSFGRILPEGENLPFEYAAAEHLTASLESV